MNTQPAVKKTILVISKVIITRPNKEFLIIKRSPLNNYCPGFWEFPGGKLEKGQDISSCIKNEIRDEVKIQVSRIKPLVYFESRILKHGSYKGLPYIGLFAQADYRSGKVQLSKEHSLAKWITLKEASKYKLTPECQKVIKTIKLKGKPQIE